MEIYMFKIWINDGKSEMPDDDILYVISKEGIFLKKKVGIVESCVPVPGISILEPLESMARLRLPKIPFSAVQAIVGFFKEVFNQHKSEAIVLLYYNEDNNRYKIVSPEQIVSPGSLNYKKLPEKDNDFILIGTIHSHASMSAFHSGTDDADEASFDGLHITFGNMENDVISVSSSVVVNGKRFKVDASEYMDIQLQLFEEEVSVKTSGRTIYTHSVENGRVVLKQVESPLIENKQTEKKTRAGFKIEPGVFPDVWMETVKTKEIPKINTPSSIIDRYGVGNFHDWRSSHQTIFRWLDHDTERSHHHPLDNSYTKEVNPCSKCVYRDLKTDMTMDDLLGSLDANLI